MWQETLHILFGHFFVVFIISHLIRDDLEVNLKEWLVFEMYDFK